MDEEQPTHAMVADPLVGRVLDGRYKIIRRLATGGMGQVYVAEQQGLGRTVAVKVLSTPPTDSEATDFRERFFREARLCSRLTHPNTVRIYDYGHTSDDVYYIVMEYLDGQTLTAILREAPLDPLRVIALASQVCASLSEAHALGLIHRDLKPDNLIITRHADGREFVRVVDFGIAKDMLGSDAPTRAGTLFGSPGYMSPEQILEKELTPASDIYSLGAILYRMLTGVKPFSQGNPMAVINRQMNAAPPNFEESNPSVRVVVSLEWVTLRCMEKDPLDRFCTASELARALRACDLELRGLMPDPDLRLLDGRLVLPPGAEEQMRRFDAGGTTNPGTPTPPRRTQPTLDPESHSHSRSLSQRVRYPALMVLGGLIPLVAGSGAVVLGMLIVWIYLVGLGGRTPGEADGSRGPDAATQPANAVTDVAVNPSPAPAAGTPAGGADTEPATVNPAAGGGAEATPEPAPSTPKERPRPRPRPKPEPVPAPPPAPEPVPVPVAAPAPSDPASGIGRTDLKDPFED